MKQTIGLTGRIVRKEVELTPAETECLEQEREDGTERLTIPQALTAVTTLLFQGGGDMKTRYICAAALLLHQAVIEETEDEP